jgi:hypothetical protein
VSFRIRSSQKRGRKCANFGFGTLEHDPTRTTKVNAERLSIFWKTFTLRRKDDRKLRFEAGSAPKEAYEEENQVGGIHACKTS